MRNSPSATSGLLLAVFCITALAQWAPNCPIDTRSLDDIYAAAQKESGPLTVAWGGDARQQGDPTVQAWQERFPNVQLNLTTDLSKYWDINIDRSFYGGAEYVDVVVLQTHQDFPRWQTQNRLLYYKPANFSLIDDGEKDLDGAWLPIFEFSFGSWVYDSTALNETDLPNTFLDLLDPKWKGKLVLTYPNDDDAIGYLFSVIISKYGFDWFNAFAQQDIKWVRGANTPAIMIDPATKNASDVNRVLSFTTINQGASTSVKLAKQKTDQYISWFQRGAAFASTKRPESSKLFLSWLLSDEHQRPMAVNGTATVYPYLNEMSGVDPHKDNLTQIDGFSRFMQDRALAEWWRFQYELTLGPVVGQNPALK